MSEQVKRKVVSAYNKVLIPFIIEEVNENLSCKSTSELNILLSQLYQRMVTLREEDTDKLERKLRKEDDPETVIRLLELKTKSEKVEQ
jgi:glutamyl-tRNA reductase